MNITRREFVATGLAGAAGLCVAGYPTESRAAEAPAPPPDEDGYKLWLRYAPPGNAAKNYRKLGAANSRGRHFGHVRNHPG